MLLSYYVHIVDYLEKLITNFFDIALNIAFNITKYPFSRCH